MKPEIRELVRYRVARAVETLEVARWSLQTGHLHSTVNRLYYACFYTVAALLLTENLSSSKHTGIRSLFARHWIKTGRLPREMGDLYYNLFEHRQKGDYADLATFNRKTSKNGFVTLRPSLPHCANASTTSCVEKRKTGEVQGISAVSSVRTPFLPCATRQPG